MKKGLVFLILAFMLIMGACKSATLTPTPTPAPTAEPAAPVTGLPQGTNGYPWWNDTVSVSYTHLTLPTKRIV